MEEAVFLYTIRTDLALEARDLTPGAAALDGVVSTERERFGYRVTEVAVRSAHAACALGKPQGTYATVDLRPYWSHAEGALPRAAQAVAEELRALLGGARAVLVAGLGNAAMTPDAVGPLAVRHVLVTRHLVHEPAFASFASVSVLTPGVLAQTGVEAAALIRGAVRAAAPDAVVVIDALASRSLSRLCATVQLSDTGLVPGSGVGNRRCAVDRHTLGVPVVAVGVPTVVDARTLACDILEEAGARDLEPEALRGGEGVMVTPRDIDAQLRELARVVGYGIDLALQPLDYDSLAALMG